MFFILVSEVLVQIFIETWKSKYTGHFIRYMLVLWWIPFSCVNCSLSFLSLADKNNIWW